MAGCGDDDATPVTATDSGPGADQVSPPTDSGGGTDTGTKTDSGPPDAGPPHAKIILVHAAPGLPALRVCFKLGKLADGSDGVIAPVAALPDQAKPGQPFPGVFPGTGGAFPDLLDLSVYALTPIVINAAKISTDVRTDGGTQRSCQDILAPDAGVVGTADAVQFATLPVGTFTPNTTLLLALTGCAAGEAGGTTPFPYTAQQKCGAAYTAANSNFAIQKFTLDKTPAGATQLGGQFINLSQGIENEAAPFAGACGLNTGCTANGVYPVIVKNDPAGDAAAAVATPLTAAPVKFPLMAPATAKGVTGVLPATASFAIAGSTTALGSDGGVGPSVGGASFPIVQTFTTGSATPADYFKDGRNYTFVLLGDPTAGPASATNGYGVHFLGFDNDPVLPPK
ncbi:MAG: hypothetical protein JWM74_3236 [Myxococcaceae bacterium]|nr:hypothetical protein [Myxococcaceae bacterium]